jgi:hypothetical protein
MNFLNLKYFLLAIILVGVAFSCQTKKTVAEKTGISFTELLSGNHSNIRTEKSLVIKEPSSFQEILNSINKTREPNIKIPEINFKKEMLLALFMGERNTGGHSIRIDSISSNEKEVFVYVKELTPQGMATMVITHPFYLAKIKKTDKQIVFKELSSH